MPNVFDFNPTNINPFPYWKWNKVLPAVYDDSLSQYEILCKLLNVVNNIIDSTNSTGEQVEQLTQLVQQLIDGGFPSGIVQYVTDIVDAAIDDDIATINATIATLQTHIAELETDSQRGDIVLIGDSYGAGYTPDGSVVGWCAKVVETFNGTNINVYTSSYGGSGFGIGVKTFTQLLTELAESMTAAQRNKVTTIIVGGGYNDRNASAGSIGSGMMSFHNAVKTYFKNAYRVTAAFIGNTVTGLPTGAHAGATSYAVRAAFTNWLYYGETSNCGISVYNGLGVLSDNTYFSSDYVHPNDRGQQVIYQAIMSIISGSPSSNFFRNPASINIADSSSYTHSGNVTFTFDPVDDNVFGPPNRTAGTMTINYSTPVSLTMNRAEIDYDLIPNAALSDRRFTITRPIMVLEGSLFYMVMGIIHFTDDANGYHMGVQFVDVSDDHTNFRTANVRRVIIYF